MSKHLYFCVGCRQLHFDDDYCEKDGDLLVYDHAKMFESVDRIKAEFQAKVDASKGCSMCHEKNGVYTLKELIEDKTNDPEVIVQANILKEMGCDEHMRYCEECFWK